MVAMAAGREGAPSSSKAGTSCCGLKAVQPPQLEPEEERDMLTSISTAPRPKNLSRPVGLFPRGRENDLLCSAGITHCEQQGSAVLWAPGV